MVFVFDDRRIRQSRRRLIEFAFGRFVDSKVVSSEHMCSSGPMFQKNARAWDDPAVLAKVLFSSPFGSTW
jgi:hypothetical protein